MTIALYESPRSAVMLDREDNVVGRVVVLGVIAGRDEVRDPNVVALIVANEDGGTDTTSGPWFYLAPHFVRMTTQAVR